MFLSKTTELAIQSLVFLAARPAGDFATPQDIAGPLGESPTYMSKVLRLLSKSGILRSHRGKSGGFELVKDPEVITLLMVVEACQGLVIGNYCTEVHRDDLGNTCRYHKAMKKLEDGFKTTLTEITIGELAASAPSPQDFAPNCKMRLLRLCQAGVE